ncbi:GNAT family N-acetyltransferase [Butyrivibrio sp.]|jgi:GNAT superfamily N-acetyltransferase|uniref:GNAT family N-acetyltransferase n=1 Tax=Butyrivibrio sp. TaxID=28121 RepID=UPI0025C2569B|nr:GNAT family N-acetyltransferase [Butyrivibrio sp.]MBE5836535.1 GNAT family N-acetyltransferase [Butyrivibrio sp.]
MNYRIMTEKDLNYVVEKNIEYYNAVEDCCWTFEKAYKRIHQVLTTEDSMCMVQLDANNNITGYLMGYFKEFDDVRGYFLEEIVIFKGFQGKGYGTDFLKELEHMVQKNGASIIELNSVNDEMHKHFYSKLSYYETKNFVMMGKFLN